MMVSTFSRVTHTPCMIIRGALAAVAAAAAAAPAAAVLPPGGCTSGALSAKVVADCVITDRWISGENTTSAVTAAAVGTPAAAVAVLICASAAACIPSADSGGWSGGRKGEQPMGSTSPRRNVASTSPASRKGTLHECASRLKSEGEQSMAATMRYLAYT
jgi:hypothetical protein